MTVYLVGAGPGDPGLVTVRGAEVLARAAVVVHDRLAAAGLLDLAPASAERIDVGKSPGAPIPQEDINALLVRHGRAGRQVVRLKGGDPFVFGRGGEEAAALAEAGVAFEVVPGISAAVAVPAYAGIPVTHRGLATSYTVVTGHRRHSIDEETDWAALARAGGTIVVLMGVAHRAEIAGRLMAAGMAASTPVAAVRWGTRPDQHTTRTTLGALGATLLEPPVTMVIGAVAGLDLAWFERRPLFGRRIVVTRSRAQSSSLVAQLSGLGAEVVELPTIEITGPADGGVALAEAARSVGRFDWIAFTSANAVERLFASLHDARDLGGVRVAAVGPATAAALAARGVVADLVPGEALAGALVDTFGPGPGARSGGRGPVPRTGGGSAPAAGSDATAGSDVGLGGAGSRPGRVLLPQAAGARDTLAVGLAARGWDVTVVEAYRTIAVPPSAAAVTAAAGADAVAFTSSSTVSNFLAAAPGVTVPPVVACIGPVTAATARDAGLAVTVVAAEHTVDGLVAALVEVLASDGPAAAPIPSTR